MKIKSVRAWQWGEALGIAQGQNVGACAALKVQAGAPGCGWRNLTTEALHSLLGLSTLLSLPPGSGKQD